MNRTILVFVKGKLFTEAKVSLAGLNYIPSNEEFFLEAQEAFLLDYPQHKNDELVFKFKG